MVVGIKASSTINNAPKNLPQTICDEVSGKVFKSSNVPALYSSAKLRIVTVGIRNNKTHGAKEKNPSSEAYPKSSKLVFGKTKNINPFKRRKTINAM